MLDLPSPKMACKNRDWVHYISARRSRWVVPYQNKLQCGSLYARHYANSQKYGSNINLTLTLVPNLFHIQMSQVGKKIYIAMQ